VTREEKAVAFFGKGYNCAQAVLGAFCEEARKTICPKLVASAASVLESMEFDRKMEVRA